MAAFVRRCLELYRYINDDLADPRTKDWPLITSPWKLTVIVFLYMYFCLDVGPKFMKNRPAFNIDNIIVLYNLCQIATCGWMAIQGFLYFYPIGYKFYCEPIDYSYNYTALLAAKLTWMYCVLKALDLLDTVFFVLRKKNSQITFLHVYHHAAMVLCGYIAARYVGGGHFILLGHVNSFCHAVMYFYYLLVNVNPACKKSLWWKKHITHLQIGQFLLLLIQYLPTLFWNDCNVNFTLRFILTVQVGFMLLLFCDFYRKAYLTKKCAD